MSGPAIQRAEGSHARPADLCIVGGAGHVGLPLAITFASKGFRVLVYDINQSALETIRKGALPFTEQGAEPLLKEALSAGRLEVSSSASDLAGAPALIITIGTPVDAFMNPVLKVIRACADELLPHLSDGQLLVLRSTVYPGTTDWLDKYLRKKGKHLKVSFCPERVVQGFAVEEIQKLPQLVSGTSPEATQAATALFEQVAPSIVHLSPIEAEFAKLFHNAYRYIKFAIANQFYMIAGSAGVDYNRVLEGMRQDYPRDREIPRAGFTAGPCLFKDTMQLAAFSNNRFTLGHTAMAVNEGLVLFVVEEIGRRFGDLDRLTVGLLGMAFKANSGDTRASLSYKLKKALAFRAEEVLTHDPYVTEDADLRPLPEVLERSDLLVLCMPHDAYRGLDTRGKPVIDIWGFLRNPQEPR